MSAVVIEPKPEFRLILIPAPDDPPLASSEYQKELSDFAEGLRAEGIKFSTRAFALDAVSGGGGASGEFILALSAVGVAAKSLQGPLAKYIKAKFARKARVEFYRSGKLKKIEAQNADEVEKITQAAAEYQSISK